MLPALVEGCNKDEVSPQTASSLEDKEEEREGGSKIIAIGDGGGGEVVHEAT